MFLLAENGQANSNAEKKLKWKCFMHTDTCIHLVERFKKTSKTIRSILWMFIMAHSKMAQTVVSALILFYFLQKREMDRPNAPKPSRKKLRVCIELREMGQVPFVILLLSRSLHKLNDPFNAHLYPHHMSLSLFPSFRCEHVCARHFFPSLFFRIVCEFSEWSENKQCKWENGKKTRI